MLCGSNANDGNEICLSHVLPNVDIMSTCVRVSPMWLCCMKFCLPIIFGRFDGLCCLCVLHVVCIVLVCVYGLCFILVCVAISIHAVLMCCWMQVLLNCVLCFKIVLCVGHVCGSFC